MCIHIALTMLIHQSVIMWWSGALGRTSAQHPMKCVRWRTLPATAAIFKRAGGPTVFLIKVIAAVINKIARLLWFVTATIVTAKQA